MFTGIIEQIGQIKKIEGNIFTISHNYEEVFEIGESISLSGMCATILRFDEASFDVEIIQQSRDLTHFGQIEEGDWVNLERAARIGQRNSGHQVTGHIDGLFVIAEIKKVEDFWQIWVQIDEENIKYVVDKGCIALDGISLTISGINRAKKLFSVGVISHTWEETILKHKKVGDMFQIEFDYLAKLVVDR